jgi:gluconate 2-dehydrogenase gamma chain
MQLNRREFVYSLAALTSAPPLTFSVKAQQSGKPQGDPLSDREMEILNSICEQIVPKDEFPGAGELGVGIFISRLLKEAHPDWIKVYRSGLRSTEKSSVKLYQKPFLELNLEEQTLLLKRMEKGDLALTDWGAFPPGEFFAMVSSHTIQGFYGHPRWGGNRGRKAWAMIDYDDWWV